LKPLPSSIKEKETHWPEEPWTPIKEKETHWPEGRLLHQGKRRTREDLGGGKSPPALDQDLEINWFFKDLVWL